MTIRRPCIGVFDSGVGGLTVLKALVELIADADYIYFGDTARLPYGSKSAETVAKYALGASQYLEDRAAELLVIACNTATALALSPCPLSVPRVHLSTAGQATAAPRGAAARDHCRFSGVHGPVCRRETWLRACADLDGRGTPKPAPLEILRH